MNAAYNKIESRKESHPRLPSVSIAGSTMNIERKLERCIELKQDKFHFYIDESGTPSNKNGKVMADNEYFILSGLFMLPTRLKVIEEKCHTVLKKHLDINDDVYPELKYADIMGKNGKYEKIKTKPEELIMDILDIIRYENLPLFIIIANKQEHQNLKYPHNEIEHYYTSPYMVYRMLMYAKNCGCKVDVIQDNFDRMQEESIKTQIELNRKNGYRTWGGRQYYESLDTYCMKDSKNLIGLQLIDICCGAVGRVLKREKIDFYDMIEPLLWTFFNSKPYFHPDLKNYENKKEASRVMRLFISNEILDIS